MFKKSPLVLLNVLIVSVIFFYFSFNFYAYVVWDTWVPDEKWFLRIANLHQDNILELKNKLGYGSIYWLVTSFFSSLKPLRLLNYFYLSIIILIYFLIGKKLNCPSNRILISILLFLSFPAVWFYGKIIGPEIFSITISLFGLYLTLGKKFFYVGIFLLSIGVSIKLNSLVIFLFAILYKLQKITTAKKMSEYLFFFLKIASVGILGFITSTPQILTDFNQVIQNYFTAKHGANQFFQTSLKYVILGEYHHTWDVIPTSGLVASSVNLISLLMFLTFVSSKKLLFVDWKILKAYLGSLFFSTIIIMTTAYAHIWYWFPIIFITPILAFSIQNNKKSNILLTIFVISNFFLNIPKIFENIQLRVLHKNILEKRNEINDFISSNKIKYAGYRFVFHTEFGLSPKPNHLTSKYISELNERDLSKDYGYSSKNDSTILFIGDRFIIGNKKIKKLTTSIDCGENEFYFHYLDENNGVKMFLLEECQY